MSYGNTALRYLWWDSAERPADGAGPVQRRGKAQLPPEAADDGAEISAPVGRPVRTAGDEAVTPSTRQ